MSGYLLHPDAVSDLEDIWEYIAVDNIDAADRVIADLFDGFQALASFPQSGHRRPDLTAYPLRFKRVRNYLIACASDERPLWIVAVLHGRRSPRLMAAILRGRD